MDEIAFVTLPKMVVIAEVVFFFTSFDAESFPRYTSHCSLEQSKIVQGLDRDKGCIEIFAINTLNNLARDTIAGDFGSSKRNVVFGGNVGTITPTTS